MKRLAVIVCLLVLAAGVIPSQAQAFSLSDLSGLFGGGSAPTATPAISGGSGFAGWLCQFIKLFCSSSNPAGTISGTLPSSGGGIPSINLPAGGTSGSNTPGLSGGGFSLSSLGGLPAEIIKKLWGDNPPPSWGGIGGIGNLPLPGGKTGNSSSGSSNGGNGGTGGSSGLPACAPGQPIKECAGGGSACQEYCTPEANRAACLTRGCYCTLNSSATDPDCTGFRELRKNPLVSRFLGSCQCGGGQTNSSNTSGGTGTNNQTTGGSSGSTAGQVRPAGTAIIECNEIGGTCQTYCQSAQADCKRRAGECLKGGASGKDCDTFKLGYQKCCVEKISQCTASPDLVSLTQAICSGAAQPGASNTPPVTEAGAPLSELQQYCQDKTTDNCQTVFDTCKKEEYRRGAIDCASLDGWCRLEPDRYFCRDHGYFAEK